jgi:hypothetical protein
LELSSISARVPTPVYQEKQTNSLVDVITMVEDISAETNIARTILLAVTMRKIYLKENYNVPTSQLTLEMRSHIERNARDHLL